jgi:hypothetical protein
MPTSSGLGKRQQSILRNQSARGFFDFESSFQNCFWKVFTTSGLSHICKIRNVWTLSSFFYSDPMFLEFNTSFWKKIYPTNSKIVMIIFQMQGFLWFWNFLLGFANTMKFSD